MKGGLPRGDVVQVRLDPAEGREIRKTRPAVVVSNPAACSHDAVVQVVPVTGLPDRPPVFVEWQRSATRSGIERTARAGRFRMTRNSVVLTALLLSLPVIGRAQAVDITPFAGYRFGGNAYNYWSATSISLDDGESYGVAVDIPIGVLGDSYLELYWSHQESGAETFGANPLSLELDIDLWQVGGLRVFDTHNPKLKPYLVGTVGATHARAKEPWSGSDTVFSAGLGGGMKLMATDHLGLRLDGRAWATFVQSGGSLGCGPGGCWFGFAGEVLWQGEVSAGIVVAF